MHYTTRHARRLYNVKSDQTIRNWIKEFQEFFSPNTAPGRGIDVQLREEDMSVLALIAQMRAARRPNEEIYATLKSGQRGDLPPYSPDQLEQMVTGDVEKYLSTQADEMRIENRELLLKLEQAENTIANLTAELRTAQNERETRIRLEIEYAAAERRTEELREQMQQLHSQHKLELDEERQRHETRFQEERARLDAEVQKREAMMERYLTQIADLREQRGKQDGKSDE